MGKVEYRKFFFIVFIIFIFLVPSFNAQSVVTIDSKNRLIVDGKPFFPNGIYSFKVPTEKDGLDRIAEARFNFILPYQEENIKPYYPYGLKIIYGPTIWYTGMPWRADWNERVMNYVEKEKNKSSLIGWCINDELDWRTGICLINKTHKPNYFICANSVVGGCNPPDNCSCSMDGAYLFSSCLRHNKIKQTDPNHPSIAILMGYNNPEFWEPFKDCADILGVAVYPNHRKNCMGIYNDTIHFHKLVDNKKPVWIVMQPCRYRNDKEINAWNQGCKPTKPYYPYCLSDPNFPSLNEIRLQAYLALIAKADGLIWWIYDYMNTKWTPEDNITLRWSNATQMGKEVQFMSPMLLEGDDYDLQASNTSILTRGLLYYGSLYILAANPKSTEKVITVTPEMKNWNPEVKFGNLSVETIGNKLKISASAYESGLIVISPKLNESHMFTVGGEAFYPAHSVDYSNSYGEGGAYIVTGNGALVTPVHLPKGAILDKFKVFFYNNTTESHASKIDVWLEGLSLKHGSSYILSELDTQGISGYGNKTASIAVQTPIDNSVWGYDIRAWSDSWQGDNLRIMGAVITYNIPPE